VKTLRAILVTLALSAAADAGTYGFTSSTGNVIVPGVTDTTNHADDAVVGISFPFPVLFGGVGYTTANLSSNGSLQFTATDSSFTNPSLPDIGLGPSIIPFWDDLYLVNSGFGIFTTSESIAPNRIFDIEWRAQYFPGSGSADFELRFYENQTYFDFIYGTITNENSATIGVQVSDSDFTQYCFNGGCSINNVDGQGQGRGLRWDTASQGVPEPTSISMIGLGVIGMLASRYFKRARRP